MPDGSYGMLVEGEQGRDMQSPPPAGARYRAVRLSALALPAQEEANGD